MKEFHTWIAEQENSIEDASFIKKKTNRELEKEQIINEYKKEVFNKTMKRWALYYDRDPLDVTDGQKFMAMYINRIIGQSVVSPVDINAALMQYRWLKKEYTNEEKLL